MSKLYSKYADNNLIFNLERKTDKYPKSQQRLSLAELSPCLFCKTIICSSYPGFAEAVQDSDLN